MLNVFRLKTGFKQTLFHKLKLIFLKALNVLNSLFFTTGGGALNYQNLRAGGHRFATERFACGACAMRGRARGRGRGAGRDAERGPARTARATRRGLRRSKGASSTPSPRQGALWATCTTLSSPRLASTSVSVMSSCQRTRSTRMCAHGGARATRWLSRSCTSMPIPQPLIGAKDYVCYIEI